MKINRISIYSICVIVLVVTIACSLFGGSESTVSSTKEDTYLGEEYRSEGGGFSIRKVKDYSFNDVIGIVNMIAPGGNDKVGPGIMVLGGLTVKGTTNDELMEKINSEGGALKVQKPKAIKVAGVTGSSGNIEGTYEGQEIKGKVVVAMVTDEQQFTLLGFSPAAEWEKLSPIFDAVLASVVFFEPNPEAGLENFSVEPTESSPTTMEENPAEASEPAYVLPTAKPGELRQWAVSARASSQYGNPDWAASQATGKPDVLECGDNTSAWASYYSDTVEWIELTYETPVIPTEINIYQNYNPSQVVEVQMTTTDGSKYIAWSGYPEMVKICPDTMSISLELEKKIRVNKLRITIDQRVSGWGWNEIDAVELVGMSDKAGTSSSSPTQKSDSSMGNLGTASGKPVPTNYSGWMAGKNYQGYVKVAINKTKENQLDGLIGLKGKKSTENFKPRSDHKDTFIYEFADGMKAYISVLSNGVVYKKSIAPADSFPKDYKLATVTKTNYSTLDATFKKDKSILYADMANLLKSPGFIRSEYFADGKVKTQYEWYAPNGDWIGGFFLDGVLTGMAGLVFIPNEK
jgi:hypothetical protein